MKKHLNLNIDTTIEIKCQDNRESKVIYDSLFPDNIDFPKNLEIDMKTNESLILLRLKFISNSEKQNNIGTLLNTVDEIMEHIGIIKNVIKND
jgi:tRNA threonylcarbamoyladenosine modification (KEOPS) complex  Pcc1 subunit